MSAVQQAAGADAATFSLERFEYLCYTRDLEAAAREVVRLIQGLDARYGSLEIDAKLYATNAPTQVGHLLARITSALSCLFSDPQFQLSPQGFAQMINWQRWLSALFAASPFGNADHVLRALNLRGEGEPLELSHANLVKFCMLFTPDSEIEVDADALWAYDKRTAAALFFALLSPRFFGTTAAHDKRETLLKWLPEKLLELDSLEQLPVGILHDVYMHCSYADLPGKHDIKRPINAMIRRTLEQAGLHDLALAGRAAHPKPVMFVVLEYFSANHSIYRTHSSTLRAARDKFHLVGFGMPQFIDDAGRAVFHEFVDLSGDLLQMLATVRGQAASRQADVLYMPSVGMFQLTMFLANLRLAPLQLMALGHPATTHSPCIDHVVVEEDYVGDPACFSEQLLVLPSDGIPYVPSAAAADQPPPVLRQGPPSVRVAICATTMKLNPRFLWACAEIVRRARQPVEFHFLVGFSQGIVGVHVEQILKQYLGPHAVVYGHQPYAAYMDVIRSCDLFLNPFPFGNTNGIVDTVSAGLVGVCRTGREVHEHIDEGLFARLGLPGWTVANTTAAYVDAAVRLIDGEDERLALRRALIAADSVQRLFQGRPQLFGERVLALVRGASAAGQAPALQRQFHT